MKSDHLREPVSRHLVQNMLKAAKKDRERRERNQEEKTQKAASLSLGVTSKKLTTKRKAIDELLEGAKRTVREQVGETSTVSTAEDETSDKCVGISISVQRRQQKKQKQSSLSSFFNPTHNN